jgi:hypothetical protein
MVVPPWVGPLLLAYGMVLLCFAANRGRKYLRFIVLSGDDPYRYWLVGSVLILMGCILIGVTIGKAFHPVS